MTNKTRSLQLDFLSLSFIQPFPVNKFQSIRLNLSPSYIEKIFDPKILHLITSKTTQSKFTLFLYLDNFLVKTLYLENYLKVLMVIFGVSSFTGVNIMINICIFQLTNMSSPLTHHVMSTHVIQCHVMLGHAMSPLTHIHPGNITSTYSTDAKHFVICHVM